jgi:hypothetical protein
MAAEHLHADYIAAAGRPQHQLFYQRVLNCELHSEFRLRRNMEVPNPRSHPGITFNKDFDVEGTVLFHHACAFGCEGIVSKRLGSRYRDPAASMIGSRSRTQRRQR